MMQTTKGRCELHEDPATPRTFSSVSCVLRRKLTFLDLFRKQYELDFANSRAMSSRFSLFAFPVLSASFFLFKWNDNNRQPRSNITWLKTIIWVIRVLGRNADVSTTCPEAIFRDKWSFQRLWTFTMFSDSDAAYHLSGDLNYTSLTYQCDP